MVENRDFFHINLAFDAPNGLSVIIVLPSRLVWKTRMAWLPDSKKL